MVGSMRRVGVVLVSAACLAATGGCSGDDEPGSTAPPGASDPGVAEPGSTDDSVMAPASEEVGDVSAAVLDQAFLAYGQCLGERLDVTLRFRPERFAGAMEEAGLPAGSIDPALVEQQRRQCVQEQQRLDSVAASYQARNPLTDDQIDQIVDEYLSCLKAGAPELASRIDTMPMDTLKDVDATYSELAGMVADPAVLNECRDTAVFGPPLRFGASDG